MKSKPKILSAVIEITDKCNLNCVHCMNRPDCIGIEITLENFSYILDKIYKHGVEKVYITGGEPLLHKSIVDIIELFAKYPDVVFLITTNGLLLSENVLRHIKKHNNALIQFSIDGACKETYEFIRGRNTYEKFLESIKLWDESGISMGYARTCITRNNYKNISDIYLFCLKHKLIPSFLFVTEMGNGKDNWNVLENSVNQKLWCINTINRLDNMYKQNVSPPEPPSACNFTDGINITSLLIRANGNIAPCQYFYDEVVGNIYNDEIEQIIHNNKIEDLIKIAKKRKQILSSSKRCLECKVRDGCGYGCIGKANNTGNIMKHDGDCLLRESIALCYSNHLMDYCSVANRKNTIHIDFENDEYFNN